MTLIFKHIQCLAAGLTWAGPRGARQVTTGRWLGSTGTVNHLSFSKKPREAPRLKAGIESEEPHGAVLSRNYDGTRSKARRTGDLSHHNSH